MHTDFFERSSDSQNAEKPSGSRHMRRPKSPPFGSSTLMTSAPRSPSITVANGPLLVPREVEDANPFERYCHSGQSNPRQRQRSPDCHFRVPRGCLGHAMDAPANSWPLHARSPSAHGPSHSVVREPGRAIPRHHGVRDAWTKLSDSGGAADRFTEMSRLTQLRRHEDLFIASVFALGAICFTLSFFARAGSDMLGLAMIVALACVTERMSIQLYWNGRVSIAFVGTVMAGLLFGPMGAALTTTAADISGLIRQERPARKRLFNFGHLNAGALMASFPPFLLGWSGNPSDPVKMLVAGAFSGFAIFAVSSVAVSGIVADHLCALVPRPATARTSAGSCPTTWCLAWSPGDSGSLRQPRADRRRGSGAAPVADPLRHGPVRRPHARQRAATRAFERTAAARLRRDPRHLPAGARGIHRNARVARDGTRRRAIRKLVATRSG